jgi:flagellar motor switch protein FliG
MAATLFVLIGETASAEVLKHLTEAEIESISRAISNAGPSARKKRRSLRRAVSNADGQPVCCRRGCGLREESHSSHARSRPAKRIMERLSSSYANANSFDAIDR